ncbi:MAG: class B sortase [Eubacterium sp.]|nr:class B sortase [Eubacterium sp.]
MKKFVKIIIPIFIIALCAAAAVHFGVFDKEQETTAAESTVSTEKKSKYQSYIDKNSDFVGYIKIDGTAVDYPVVQCNDDEFYLTHNFDKQPEERGAIYMSSECDSSLRGFNTVLYGHNWLDTTMFSEVTKYENIDFYKEHPVIHFNTAHNDMQWKIFAVFITNADENEDDGYIFNYIYPHLGGENFSGYIGEVNKRTLYKTGVDVNSSDKILTLSTCSRKMDISGYRADARIVVAARLVRDGESSEVDTSKAEINPNPKYPQRYCDNMGIQNVYSNDEKWYPFENE